MDFLNHVIFSILRRISHDFYHVFAIKMKIILINRYNAVIAKDTEIK